MPIVLCQDLGLWLEAECYYLLRLAESYSELRQPLMSCRHRLWRIHQILEHSEDLDLINEFHNVFDQLSGGSNDDQ